MADLRTSVVAVLFVIGCGPSTPQEPAEAKPVAEIHGASVSAAPSVQGYVHSPACSVFHLGASPTSIPQGNYMKIVGSEGVLGTNQVTGAVRGILNADSPENKVPPLTSDPSVHNARVRDYFVGCGLPSDQIFQTQILTLMTGGGPSSVPPQTTSTFAGYTTVITRQIDGIGVPDSFAAARFDANGVTTMEWAYWPPIPQSVVDQAKQYAAAVADAVQWAAIQTKLPPPLRGLAHEVTIRHSDFADASGFVSFASIDIHVTKDANGGFRGGTRNFDINGNEIIHPNRRPGRVSVDTPKP